jgi:hypothetical protein
MKKLAAARSRAGMGPRDQKEMTAVLQAMQAYANRGVFRGFSADHTRAGGAQFRFTWITRQPMTVTYDPKAAALVFRDLLPGIERIPGLLVELKTLLSSHTGPSVPASRRIDPARVGLRTRVRAGKLSLLMDVRGPHHKYAVQRGLNLVNQLFLHLQAYYPDYLVDHFGFSSE